MTGSEEGKACPTLPVITVISGYPSSLPVPPVFKKTQTHLIPHPFPAKPGKEHARNYSASPKGRGTSKTYVENPRASPPADGWPGVRYADQ